MEIAEILLKFLYLHFLFIQKNSKTGSRKTSTTQELSVVESWRPLMSNVFNLLSIGYNIPSHFNDLRLARITSLQLCIKVNPQNLRLVYEIFPFLKLEVSVIHFLNLLIVIELLSRNWKEKCLICIYFIRS